MSKKINISVDGEFHKNVEISNRGIRESGGGRGGAKVEISPDHSKKHHHNSGRRDS